MSKINNQHHQAFEAFVGKQKSGEIMGQLKVCSSFWNISRWDKFKLVILKAIKACETSGIDSSDHFPRVGKWSTF